LVTFLYYIIGFITIYFVTKYFNFVYNFIVLFYYKNFNILVIYIIKEDIKKVDEYVVTPYKIGSNTINKEDDINDIAIEIPQNREEIINLEPIKNNLRIALLSQNTIKNVNTLFSFNKVRIPDIKNNEPDIYIEMTQEDSRFVLGSLTDIPDNSIYNTKHISLNKIGGIDKNVIMQIYYKKLFEEHIKNSFVSGTIELEHKEGKKINKFYATKGAVYIYIKLPSYNPLLFVNMHLPIDTKDRETFGYEHRKNSLLKVINELKEKFQNDDPIIIIGGDLNFRINPNDRNDQLTEFLKSNENPSLSELEFPDQDGKIFTCKFTNNNNACRKQIEPPQIDNDTATIETINEIKEEVQEVCGDKDRFPSRCDRFLTNHSDKIDVKLHKGDYIQSLQSDHNAIYVLLEIKKQQPQIQKQKYGGKRITKRKKMVKRKTNRRKK